MNVRKTLLVGALMVAIVLPIMACNAVDEINRMFFPPEYPEYETDISSSATTLPHRLVRSELDIQNPQGDRLLIKARTPGPPYPSYATITWSSAKWEGMLENVHASHPEYQTENHLDDLGCYKVAWQLPVDPKTGETPQVELSYDFLSDSVERLDSFTVQSDQDGEPEHKTIFRLPPGNKPETVPVEPIPLQPEAQAAIYELWNVWIDNRLQPDAPLTADRCEYLLGVLQSGRAFMALRFPVTSPSVAATQVYTMPISFSREFSPTLRLVQIDPYETHLSIPLEYRPAYLGFLENVMPEAPGEHWLALGTVLTPTVDCSGLPEIPQWQLETNFHLDLGGSPVPPANPLPLYYCYEGAEGPLVKAALGSDGNIFQDWNITCLGPQQVSIKNFELSRLLLGPSNTAWITSTQTISFSHEVVNKGFVPITITVDYTSTLGLTWGIYSGTEEGPDLPLVPLPDTFTLKGSWSRYFWAIANVPVAPGTAMGSEMLALTATDVNRPERRSLATDLLWLGVWADPPLPPWQRQINIYLPIILK